MVVASRFVSDIFATVSFFSRILPDVLSWIVPSHSPTGQKVPELASAVKLYSRRHY